MNIVNHNKNAWDKKVEDQSVYTKAVTKDTIEKSKADDWKITVTTKKPIPRSWFPTSLHGLKILCLASGGGQQGPVLAVAGAEVTVVDISEKQLEKDESLAKDEGLNLKTIQGDMSNLHFFENDYFDMVVHPVSNHIYQKYFAGLAGSRKSFKEKRGTYFRIY